MARRLVPSKIPESASPFADYVRQLGGRLRDEPGLQDALSRILCKVAAADGSLTADEVQLLAALRDAGESIANDDIFRPREEWKESPHEILGVSEGARPEEIKAAYRRLVRECHPDGLSAAMSPRERAERLAFFNEVQEAYRTLLASFRK